MDEKEYQNDHDTLITLVADVKNLIAVQKDFHTEMKDSFKDLKENYSSRLDGHDVRLTKLENYRSWIVGAFSLGTIVISLIIYIYFSDIHGIKEELSRHESETQSSLSQLSH